MSNLSAFDPSKHQIGLAPADLDTLYGFLLLGGYTRAGQQLGSPQEFGGQNELISNQSLSRWVQDDFSGGAYQYEFGKDPAMFSGGENLLPSQFDRSVRTAPPMQRAINFSGVGARTPLLAVAIDGCLILVFTCGTVCFDLVTGTTTLHGDDFGNSFLAADWITAAAFDQAKREIVFAVVNPSNGATSGQRVKVPTLAQPSGTGDYTAFVLPSTSPYTVRKMGFAAGMLIVQSGVSLYAGKLPANSPADATAMNWQFIGRLPGKWKDSVQFNGALYILCSNAEDPTKLVTVDPTLIGTGAQTAILPVADFPYNFRGDSLATIGGRVYVGGSGTDSAGADRYAELYEVSASSVRLVRTFAPESRMNNVPHKPKTIRSMVAHEGLLFFCDKGRGLVAYDLTTDSLYPSSMLQPADGVRDCWTISSARDNIYAYVTHPTDTSQNGVYRVCQGSDAITGGAYYGKVYTSDFGPEPDRKKRWSKATVKTRYGTPALAYSIDNGSPGGDTYYDCGIGTVEQHGDTYYTTFDLSGIPTSAHVRFRIQLGRGTDVSGFTELVAFTCAFAFLDTGKWVWNFTINGTGFVETLDGGAVEQDVHDIGTELRRWWREALPLTYRDVDGETYKAVVSRYQESQPFVAPPWESGISESAPENFIQVTLTEV